MTAAVAADGRHGSDVEDPSVGLVTSMLEAAPSARDPDVAVQVARIADIKAYDWPLATASDGSGAGLTVESAYGAAIGECCERYALATIPAGPVRAAPQARSKLRPDPSSRSGGRCSTRPSGSAACLIPVLTPTSRSRG